MFGNTRRDQGYTLWKNPQISAAAQIGTGFAIL